MIVLFLRHGHDLPGPAGENSLSSLGRHQVRATIEQAAQGGIERFDLALTSEALRARETLELASHHIPVDREIVSSAVHPAAPPERIFEEFLSHLDAPDEAVVLVVGHEPQLTNAIFLAAGAAPPPPDQRRDLLQRGEGVFAPLRLHDSQIKLDPDDLVFFGEEYRPVASGARASASAKKI